MRVSNFFIPTLKEEPSDAVIKSHKLMIKAGLIRKIGAGLYSYLPLGWRVFKKVENIIRDEMNKAGALEFSLPILTPAEMWKATGRWDAFGPELIRIKDRNDQYFALGPTHEEVFTYHVKEEINSYKQLPVIFYQIKTKFRDEIRPRFGVMRCREFTMKDAYSFDVNEEGLNESYNKMREAYKNIFRRCGLNTIIVEADVGAMGGTKSEEFMVLSDIGEEIIVNCPKCGYASNLDKAESFDTFQPQEEELKELKEIDTPDIKTIEELTEFLNTIPQKFIKCLIYLADNKPVAVLIRGDLDVNETKLKNALNVTDIKLADFKTIEEVTGAPVGFAGPVGLKNVPVYADFSIKRLYNAITGANKKDKHIINVNIDRDFKVDKFFDLKTAKEGSLCINCKSPLIFKRGIEVGHIFKLGYKYTKSIGAKFLDKDHKEKNPVMGCYGIGLDRTIAAIIEQYNDKDGIIWPITVAPFEIIIIPVNYKEKKVKKISDELYEKLKNKYEVILEDRDVSPGFKFKDADLIGIPIKIIISERNLADNRVEIKLRRNQQSIIIDLNNFEKKLEEIYLNEYALYKI